MATANGPIATVRLLHDGVVHATGQDAIHEAAHLLVGGEVVAIPTDTVYGLAASLGSECALQTIFRIKGRPRRKSLPVLIDDATSAGRLIRKSGAIDGHEPDPLLALAARYWPGALTIAVTAGLGLPPEVLALDGTIGLRVPDNRVARELIALAGGAIAVTSANRSGHSPALDAQGVLDQLGDPATGLRWILDGGPGVLGIPSTVVGHDGESLTIHRQGAIDEAELQKAWGSLRASRANRVR